MLDVGLALTRTAEMCCEIWESAGHDVQSAGNGDM